VSARITLLTDFGTRDGYVAAMKGVIVTLAPTAIIDDATHDIAPGEILTGAYVLARYFRLYPPGSIHVAVVDPGVGTDRRALAASIDDRLIVAPDNGLISEIVKDSRSTRLVEITHPDIVRPDRSSTFHGRDVFAPAAARLATGLQLDDLGPALDDPVLLQSPPVSIHADRTVGEVIAVDRFGNLITNIPGDLLSSEAKVSFRNGFVAPLRHTFAAVNPGELVAVIGSDGFLEIAVRDGSAAEYTKAWRGIPITVTR